MNNNILEYKGYFTHVQYSVEDGVLYGRIEGIADLVTFESENCAEIEREFQAAVDDYLALCEEVGKEPEKAYKGSFNIRISPDLHKKADFAAKKRGITLNQFVAEAIANYLEKDSGTTIIYYPTLIKEWGSSFSVGNYAQNERPQTSKSEVTVQW